jgi:hypothetical protein
MLIWEDAAFVDRRTGSVAGGASVQLPVTAAVAASTGVILPDINPRVSSADTANGDRSIIGFSEGSGIFAFEYRAVRRSIYSVSRDFTVKLGGYGARMEKDSLFSHGDSKDLSAELTETEVEMDEEDVDWPDVIDDGPEVGQLGSFNVAFGESPVDM